MYRIVTSIHVSHLFSFLVIFLGFVYDENNKRLILFCFKMYSVMSFHCHINLAHCSCISCCWPITTLVNNIFPRLPSIFHHWHVTDPAFNFIFTKAFSCTVFSHIDVFLASTNLPVLYDECTHVCCPSGNLSLGLRLLSLILLRNNET